MSCCQSSVQVGVQLDAEVLLGDLEQILEVEVIDAQHDIGVHLDEAAVAVVGEARVAGLGGEALDRHVVEAEVEHRVHHAGHGGPRAGTHRYQERVVRIAEDGAGLLNRGEGGG